MIRNLFVPSWPGHSVDNALSASLALARRHGSHIDAVFIRPDMSTYYESMSYGSVIQPVPFDELEAIDCDAERIAFDRFEGWRRNHKLGHHDGIASCEATASWSDRQGSFPREIARRGRLSDVIVMNLPVRPSIFNAALDAALFETGRPVLAIPAVNVDRIAEHVAIAWNGSLSATRAVAAAMPILQKADRVSVLMVNAPDKLFIDDREPSDLDLPLALRRHGICSETLKYEVEGASVGDTLLHAAQSVEATMLVLGAYTNGRVIEALTGGVTRHILRNAKMPILLAH